MRYTRSVAAIVAGVLAAGWLMGATASPVDEARHKSGLSLVGPGPYQARATNEIENLAHREALRLARANPNDLGYPWLSHGVLVQRHVTAKGKALTDTIKAPLPRRNEAAQRTYAELEQIKHDVIMLRSAGVADADVIMSSQPDDERNRVIVTVKRPSDRLMSTLVGLYGADTIAVRVDPEATLPRSTVGDRANDLAPFSGGGGYSAPGNSCTIGFPWSEGFLTAGHCLPAGGMSWKGSVTLGETNWGDENWTKGVGTVPFPGQDFSQARGDLAIIRAPRDTVRTSIFVGPWDSFEKRWVAGIDYPDFLDAFCTGGKNTGELCDWHLVGTRMDIPYDNNEDGVVDEIALDMTMADRFGSGVVEGDSGGPVYKLRADGTVAAMGIISGKGGNGNTYSKLYFTDIEVAETDLPGNLRKLTGPAYILNDNSRQCLAIANGSKDPDARAIQWNCTGSTAQQFYIELHPTDPTAIRIINAGSGLCLSVKGSSTTDGAIVHQWGCSNSSYGQKWYYGANGSLVNKSGKCMAIGSGSQTPGAAVIQWTCTGSPAQRWNWYWLE